MKTTIVVDSNDVKDIRGNRSKFIREAIHEKLLTENRSTKLLKAEVVKYEAERDNLDLKIKRLKKRIKGLKNA